MLVILNYYSFRVLFDKIAYVYFFEKNINILALEAASPGNRNCANCISALSFPIASRLVYQCSAAAMTEVPGIVLVPL